MTLCTTYTMNKFVSRSFTSIPAKSSKFPVFPALAAVSIPAIAYYFYQKRSVSQQMEVKTALIPDQFVSFKLAKVLPINHNTSTFRFALPSGTTELGLPTASCLVTKMVDGTDKDEKPKIVIRPYTPVEDPALGYTGYFDLIIKKYAGGPMSTHIFNMKPGDTLDMKGPIKKWDYQPNQFKEIGLIAGGTGITPMLQLIQRIMADPQDKTRVNLLFANVREGDILLREYLDDLAAKRPNSFKVHYILEKHVFIINVVNTRPPAGWNQGVGYVAENQLKEFMPKPSQGKVFVCGPNPMLNHVCGLKNPDKSQGEIGGLLKKLGYASEDVLKF